MLKAIRKSQVIGIRAGTAPHRFIAVWVVVVENRVFIRSWSLKPNSWHSVFVKEPRGTLQIEGQDMPIRTVQTRSQRLKDAVSQAFLDKYKTPGAIRYARDLGSGKSRATTTELVPQT